MTARPLPHLSGQDPPEPAPGVGNDSVEVAILDRDGVVVSVNRAWRDFAAANGGDPASTGVGASYLAACEAAAGDPLAAEVASAIRAGVAGLLVLPVRVVIPCHGHGLDRWFEVYVSSRMGADGAAVGAVVALVPLGEHGPDEPHGVDATTGAGPAYDGLPDAELQRSATVLDTLPDAVVLVDSSGRIVLVNEELQQLSGYLATDLIGQPVEVLVPDDVSGKHPSWQAAFLGAPSVRTMSRRVQARLRKVDGSAVPVEISLATAQVSGQRLTVAAVRDVRPRQRLEERLALVADLLDIIDDAVEVVDLATGHPMYANRAALDQRGATLEELASAPDGSALAPEDRGRLADALAAVASGPDTQTVLQVQVRRPDGSVAPAEVRLSYRPRSMTTTDTGSGDYVVTVSRDISSQVAAQARLTSRERLFRTTFEKSPTGICLMQEDASGHRRILRANQALAELLGRPVLDLVGADMDSLIRPEEQDQDLAEPRLFRCLRPDGRMAWAEMRASALPAADWSDLSQVIGDTAGPVDEGAGGAGGEGSGPPVLLAHLVDVSARILEERDRARRAGLADLVARISTGVLAGQPMSETYQDVAEGIATLLEATHVALALPDSGTGHYRVVAGVGPLAVELRDGRIPVDEVLVTDLAHRAGAHRFLPPSQAADRMTGGVGPCAALPFGAPTAGKGAITVMRPPGAEDFADEDLDLLDQLGRQLSLVVELGAGRADRERLGLLEQRHGLARDLHDTVMQDLLAAGMQLDVEIGQMSSGRGIPTTGEHLPDLLESIQSQLDMAIQRLRQLVFELGPAPRGRSLTDILQTIVHRATRMLGFEPSLAFAGPVDALPPRLGDELVAVLLESLSNVAQHAGSHRVQISLTVAGDHPPAGRVHLVVQDDGVGIAQPTSRGNGLDNIFHRAQHLGGHAEVSSVRPTGTRLDWTVPIVPTPASSPPMA